MPNAELMNPPCFLAALLDRVRAGSDVLLTASGEAGRDLLDAAAAELSGGYRTVRVSAREPGLSLTGLMAQVAGVEAAAQDDAVLELGYHTLAVPDAPGGHIVWLIDGAELLQRPALRYVQHMICSARALILVMAGGPAFSELLAGDDFARLRARLQLSDPTDVSSQALVPVPAAPMVLETRRSGPFLLIAGAGIAASVALGVWIGRTKWDPSPVTAAAAQAPAPLAPAQAADAAPVQAPAPVAIAAVAQAPITLPAPATPPTSVTPTPPAVESGHDRARLAQAPNSETGHPRRTRHADARPRDVVAGPRAAQAARLTEAPPPGYGRAWDEQAPDWAYAGRPAPNWQPRPYDGYADGSEPNSYIGTFSADRFGYRTFRYTP